MPKTRKIQEINIARMGKGAHYEYIDVILKRAEEDAVINSQAKDLVAALKAAKKAEADAMKLPKKSMLTEKIVEADKDRDKYYMSYKKVVNSYRNMPEKDVADAAKKLWQHIKDYQINTKYPLDQQTGLMMSFLGDLEDTYNEEVALLDLGKFVTLMKNANQQVISLTHQRTIERMNIPVGAWKTSRLASDNAYRNLISAVNALVLLHGEEDYAAFIDYVNEQINHYKQEAL